MPHDSRREQEAAHSVQRANQDQAPARAPAAESGHTDLSPTTAAALLSNLHIQGRGNAPVRHAAVQRLQQTRGNSAAQRFIQRALQNTAAADAEVKHSDTLGAEVASTLSAEATNTPVATQLQSAALGALPIQRKVVGHKHKRTHHARAAHDGPASYGQFYGMAPAAMAAYQAAAKEAGIKNPRSRLVQTIGDASASSGFHHRDGFMAPGSNGQYSYSARAAEGSVAYSAAADLSVRELDKGQIEHWLEALARHGFAAWYRPWYKNSGGSNFHIHAVYSGVHMKKELSNQIDGPNGWLHGGTGWADKTTSHPKNRNAYWDRGFWAQQRDKGMTDTVSNLYQHRNQPDQAASSSSAAVDAATPDRPVAPPQPASTAAPTTANQHNGPVVAHEATVVGHQSGQVDVGNPPADSYHRVSNQIVATIESGGDYGGMYTSPTDNGIVTYGIHQATVNSGDLLAILDLYIKNAGPQNATAQALKSEYRDWIARDRGKTRDEPLRHAALKGGRLRELLKAAAKDDAMIHAQDTVFTGKYWVPAKREAAQIGVHSALGYTVLYDSLLQGQRMSVWNTVRTRLGLPHNRGHINHLDPIIGVKGSDGKPITEE
ncbi:MAG: chitosanase, partial [Chloroflexota bacterium]|nr:chitosanase [Chloroflexota bacterium]